MSQNPKVIIHTNLGDITVKLDADKAPISTENFLKYVDTKHYDGTIFHRVIKDFMIQGGGHFADMKQKSPALPPIKNEAKNGLLNKRGTLAMARTNDINSATAQFFINVVDNGFLNHTSESNYGYAVFGEVTEGMDVVDKIRSVRTTSHGHNENVPVEPVVITSIEKL
jgi:cyclophilin family peptidyl-prolyl cis-trans isomerase